MIKYEETVKSRKLSKKSLKNWTEDKYFRLWYLYEAVKNGINYDHFVLEVGNIVPNRIFDLYNLYHNIQTKSINKDEFIEQILEHESRKRGFYERFVDVGIINEPAEF